MGLAYASLECWERSQRDGINDQQSTINDQRSAIQQRVQNTACKIPLARYRLPGMARVPASRRVDGRLCCASLAAAAVVRYQADILAQ
ncbi:MAG: hypothetical protein ACI83P_000277 [Janthinobacterium sp.]|jgi:hypothetical protein